MVAKKISGAVIIAYKEKFPGVPPLSTQAAHNLDKKT
jgi:hypothetical protein